MRARRWFGLVAVSLAVATIIVDSTIVNVAIPSIVSDLSASSTQVLWVQESYTLVFASLLLAFGTLADSWGRRRMLLGGVALFALASVAAALAPSPDLLIAARVVQGIGGAMILPTTLALVNVAFSGRERAIAFAVWGSTIGGMAAVGPLLGGWLTTDFSWRWAFGINVALGAIIVVGVLLFVDESRQPGGERVDPAGVALSVLTCGALVFALIEGRTDGWWAAADGLAFGAWAWPLGLSPIPLVFALAVVSGALFVAVARARRRRGLSSMLALDLLRISSFRNGNLTAMVVALGEFGIILTLPIWLQNALGYSAVQSGLTLLALAVGSFVASAFAGIFSGRVSGAVVVRAGLVAEIIGVAGIGLVVSASTEWYQLVPFLGVYGFGVGLATAQLTGVILQDVPLAQSGRGSATQSTSRQIGSALGIAILGTVLYSATASVLTATLGDQGLGAAEVTRVVDAVVDSSGSAIAGLGSTALVGAARDAFSQGTRFAAFSAAAFLALGFLSTFRLPAASAATPTSVPPPDLAP